MHIYPVNLKAIEGFLVSEFRTAQSLLKLVQDERVALFLSDTNRLIDLSRQKEALLNRMESQSSLRTRLYKGMGWSVVESPMIDLMGALQEFQPADVERLMRLQQGILVVTNQTREIARGNRALANRAIHQMVGLDAVDEDWKTPDLPALLSALVGAYDVLSNQEDAAIPEAMQHLNVALEQFERMLGQASLQSAERGTSVQGIAQSMSPVPPGRPKLVEGVTRLFRRQSAYQSVLESSSRMLSYLYQ